jgi:hypothetical protein
MRLPCPLCRALQHGAATHSAIGYVTPQAKLEGRDREILDERDRKLEAARERRKQQWQAIRRAALNAALST